MCGCVKPQNSPQCGFKFGKTISQLTTPNLLSSAFHLLLFQNTIILNCDMKACDTGCIKWSEDHFSPFVLSSRFIYLNPIASAPVHDAAVGSYQVATPPERNLVLTY